MAWVRLDDQFPDHPKIVAAGPLAGWLYVCGLTYCARYLTDGLIPAAQVRRLADVPHPERLAARLVAAGLWETTADGYRVHDYLDYNPSAAQTIAVRAARAEAGKRGGRRSGQVRAAHIDEANDQPTAKQIASSFASPGLHTLSKQNRTPAPAPLDLDLQPPARSFETPSANTAAEGLAGGFPPDDALPPGWVWALKQAPFPPPTAKELSQLQVVARCFDATSGYVELQTVLADVSRKQEREAITHPLALAISFLRNKTKQAGGS